jgi:hypothetical protein
MGYAFDFYFHRWIGERSDLNQGTGREVALEKLCSCLLNFPDFGDVDAFQSAQRVRCFLQPHAARL